MNIVSSQLVQALVGFNPSEPVEENALLYDPDNWFVSDDAQTVIIFA